MIDIEGSSVEPGDEVWGVLRVPSYSRLAGPGNRRRLRRCTVTRCNDKSVWLTVEDDPTERLAHINQIIKAAGA